MIIGTFNNNYDLFGELGLFILILWNKQICIHILCVIVTLLL